MSRRIAVYGKGGIGKSTVSSNLTAALSEAGVKVMQIGCDPKHDSTRSLLGGNVQETVLDRMKDGDAEPGILDDVVATGYMGCLCVEAGGPEPGVGCAGRGIISAFDLLESLGADKLDVDVILYDVLGDVVCGGFAVPMRTRYADTIFIVTSGEFMSIYAANNILRGAANYGGRRIGGLIFNSRGDPSEDERVDAFSAAVGIPIIAKIGRSDIFMEAERLGQTVVQAFPGSDAAADFRRLASRTMHTERSQARFLEDSDLEELILGRTPAGKAPAAHTGKAGEETPQHAPFSSRPAACGSMLCGCAFSGAASVCTSVEGLSTVLHGPSSCAHFTVQLDSSSIRRSGRCGFAAVRSFWDPNVSCTLMDEKAMIFGGSDGLRRSIEDRIASGERCIAVITSCPPGIIGDPVSQICLGAEEAHPGTAVIPLIEDGNAAGDFMQGVVDAGIGLVRRLAAKGEKMPLTVDLVGSKTMSSSAMSEISQVRECLSRLGISVNCILPGMSSVDELRTAGRASACLRLNPDGFSRTICDFMEKEYGIPALKTRTAGGISEAAAWIGEVGRFFGRKKEADALIAEMKERFADMLSGPKEVLRGKTLAIVSLSREVSWITETAEAAGMETVFRCIIDRADFRDESEKDIPAGFSVRTASQAAGIAEEISRLAPDIVAAPSAMDLDPSIYQTRIPYAPAADPFAGRWLAEDWARGMLAPRREGWRNDV